MTEPKRAEHDSEVHLDGYMESRLLPGWGRLSPEEKLDRLREEYEAQLRQIDGERERLYDLAQPAKPRGLLARLWSFLIGRLAP